MRVTGFPSLILLAVLWFVQITVAFAGEKTGASVWVQYIDAPLAITISGRFVDPQTDQVVERHRTFEEQKDIDAVIRALTSASLQRLSAAEAAPYFDKNISFPALSLLKIEFQYADKPDREVFMLNSTLIFDKMVFEADRDINQDIWPFVK